ncbi:HdeD family acid-resistance protein [Methanocella sp. MCL-LM]|uniref:HdeD family acid-resistance protein n=1 Tax=Methanocella sp. MCL-LM TaxID=3412035 RepID=UPI003C73CE3D
MAFMSDNPVTGGNIDYGTWNVAWWDVLLRGLIAIAFGLALFFWPGLSLAIFVLLFAAFSFIDGILMLLQTVTIRDGLWWVRLIHGVIAILAAIVAVVWPGLTLILFAYLIGFYWAFTGILQIVVGFGARKAIRGEMLLIAAGVIMAIVGAVMLIRPVQGIVALAQVIGIFNIALGVLLAVLAVKLKLVENKAPAVA